MGCAASKNPDQFLVTQVRPEHVILNDAIVRSNYLELHGRRDKDSSLTTVLDQIAAPLSRPVVKVWEKPDGGGVVVQIAKDIWSPKSRDPVVTFFDGGGKPVAVLVFQHEHLKTNSTGDGRPVLYARDIPGRTEGLVDDDVLGGNKLGAVPASRKMADGTVMPCVGIIHRTRTGDGADLGLFRVDGDQFIQDQAELIYAGGAVQEVKNAKGEGVAFRTLDQKKVFVAAGADAVLALALIMADDVRRTKGSVVVGDGEGFALG